MTINLLTGSLNLTVSKSIVLVFPAPSTVTFKRVFNQNHYSAAIKFSHLRQEFVLKSVQLLHDVLLESLPLLPVHDPDVDVEGGGDRLVVADPELVGGGVGGDGDPLENKPIRGQYYTVLTNQRSVIHSNDQSEASITSPLHNTRSHQAGHRHLGLSSQMSVPGLYL